MRAKKQYSDFFSEANKVMSPESIKKSNKKADNILLKLKLSDLRKGAGLKQAEIPGFAQTSISRIESRADLKLSTLVDYVQALGMSIEIRAISKSKSKTKQKDILILKS
ncbi:helix-turn-helix domain-containing protein [Leptospira interrogans]|uniref:Helix-turn-helix domain-containing protein n=4 Tax=Leptospira interrogans TaxID=173 RepID=A0AAQ0B195_LEPIR|nr:helix-turn-helix transcriptional regulator [Leptospira interrogans]EMM97704.1 putative toxin-antitoxin system, antitoxin component, Xre family [Leptospira interrogans serovar Zanoni str. LT2156]EMN70325.1 toxin-antitoxin system, antitoxin component, Xre family [Leptospira interrogans serovar Bataviae str. UI 08561]KAA1292665.1 XRE family transcriptional regulator [Leptospira interrogans serovar Geyaweera]QOI53134.1 helix-turn-helix domain-containing protein [Leptospira interrogans serovar Ba